MNKKRFISAASCPSCLQIDTLLFWQESKDHVIECVKCGYSAKQNRCPSVTTKASISSEQIIEIFKPQ